MALVIRRLILSLCPRKNSYDLVASKCVVVPVIRTTHSRNHVDKCGCRNANAKKRLLELKGPALAALPEELSGGRAVECRSQSRWFNSTYRRFETWAVSFTPHLPVSLGRDAKSRRSLLYGVYARESKISHNL